MSKKHTSQSPRILQVRKDRNYDCVYVKGKKIMLGKSGSPEAEAAYRQLQVKILTDPTFSAPKPQQVLVDDLCFAYLKYAKEHDPDHYGGIKTAVNILIDHYTGQPVDVLDTRHFLHLQDKFVDHGVSRQYCNMLMNYIRAMLKWGRSCVQITYRLFVYGIRPTDGLHGSSLTSSTKHGMLPTVALMCEESSTISKCLTKNPASN